jgi:hypothetical protein
MVPQEKNPIHARGAAADDRVPEMADDEIGVHHLDAAGHRDLARGGEEV